MNKKKLFAELGYADPSAAQRAAYDAANDTLTLTDSHRVVAKEFFVALTEYKFPNRAQELVAAMQFATWLNGCKTQ